MAIGDPFTVDIPAVGASGTQYASDVNDLLQEIVDRLNVPVPVGSIDAADADLDMNNHAVENAEYVRFYEQTAAPSGAPYGRIAYYGSEFYMVTPSGAVKVTDAGGLNVAATGGIAGDYGTGPEAVTFDNATETYEFWDDQAGADWAILKARQLSLIDEASGYVASVTPSASMAANQAYVLPPADPASGVSVLVMNSSGQILLAENSSPSNVFTTVLPKHADLEYSFAPTSNDWWVTTGSASRNTTSGKITHTDPFTVEFPLPELPVGRRLKSVKVRCLQSAASTATVTVYSITDGGAPASIGSGNSAVAGSTITVTASVTPDTVAFGKIYKCRVAFTGGGAGLTYEIYAVSLTYDYT